MFLMRITQLFLQPTRLSTKEMSHFALTPQLQSIIILWLVLIFHSLRIGEWSGLGGWLHYWVSHDLGLLSTMQSYWMLQCLWTIAALPYRYNDAVFTCSHNWRCQWQTMLLVEIFITRAFIEPHLSICQSLMVKLVSVESLISWLHLSQDEVDKLYSQVSEQAKAKLQVT